MKTKLLIISTCLLIYTFNSKADVGSFVVKGDIDKFYPVIISDANWNLNKTTEFFIGRSDIHTDGQWRGTIMAQFIVHTTNWGHGSNFIDVNFYQGGNDLLAGWVDATQDNGNKIVIIWLKGGTMTYSWSSSVNIVPMVYDGISNALPFLQPNGPARTYKTEKDSYVNNGGQNFTGTIYSNGGGTNYFNGNVGIGTLVPNEKLSVNGKIRAKEVKVEVLNWPDYVFEDDYEMLPIKELEKFIQLNKHLPGIVKAKEAEENGVEMGEMVKLLLKKQEELVFIYY